MEIPFRENKIAQSPPARREGHPRAILGENSAIMTGLLSRAAGKLGILCHEFDQNSVRIVCEKAPCWTVITCQAVPSPIGQQTGRSSTDSTIVFHRAVKRSMQCEFRFSQTTFASMIDLRPFFDQNIQK